MQKDESFGEYGDKVLDAIVESLGNQEKFIPAKSNLKQNKKDQIPDNVLKKRISAEIREYQITAGLTTTQRKILKAKIDAMRTRVYEADKNYTTDAQIARACGVHPDTVSDFNHNETCRNALMTCTKFYAETVMPDLMANLMVQAKDFWQPNIKIFEIIQQYTRRQSVETINRNLNVNLEMGNSPDAIMKQVVIKFGSVGYDRDRFESEIMATWDALKAEGAF
jgi:hypothetical protein